VGPKSPRFLRFAISTIIQLSISISPWFCVGSSVGVGSSIFLIQALRWRLMRGSFLVLTVRVLVIDFREMVKIIVVGASAFNLSSEDDGGELQLCLKVVFG
jgi:hypothetical protein